MPGLSAVQQAAHAALMTANPATKIETADKLYRDLNAGAVAVAHPDPVLSIPRPGRPPRPELVAPKALEKRGLGSERGRACLIHAVAHIEFNAINLALDAIYRFPGMPPPYYRNWAGVARDEGRHFQMLAARLRQLGYRYGDFKAHNGLWEMALATEASCLERMALVPRVLEARGLDVTPAMIQRFDSSGDSATADVLRIILEEEVEHVAIGTRWFRHECERENREPEEAFISLVRDRFGSIKLPLNDRARAKAGFAMVELTALKRLARVSEGR